MTDLLWVSLETPDSAGGGGQRRQFHQIRALQRAGVDVTVATLRGPQADERIAKVAPTMRFSDRSRRGRRYQTLEHVVTTVLPRRAIVAHVETVPAAAPVLTRHRVPFLVDFHNVVSRWHRVRDEPELAAQWEESERVALEAALRATACSDQEADALRSLDSGTAIDVAPHGVDPAEWPESAVADSAEPAVAMFASWTHGPNAEAAEWFVNDVWPRVRKDAPAATLLLFGPGSPPASARAATGVEVRGRVDDLATALGRVRVAVVPIRRGVGTRMKFIESLASGAAVVSTSMGCEGFDGGDTFVCADDPEAFARACAELVEDEQRARELGRRGRALALGHYQWDAVSRPLVDFATGGREP